jgi:hypothetical protein
MDRGSTVYRNAKSVLYYGIKISMQVETCLVSHSPSGVMKDEQKSFKGTSPS